MPRSPRVGGCTFAEEPGCSASDARLLWSAAFDPSVLRARPAGGAASTDAAPSLATCLAVAGDNRLHAVIGGVHHGIRIDLASSVEVPPINRLIFPFTVAVAPKQLAEFRRLVGLARGQPLAAVTPPRLYRVVLALRVIDALGEGASLRTIGEAFVRAGDWPGCGESTKSAARRLRTAALTIWNAGPRSAFS
jgi:hypothetical protein